MIKIAVASGKGGTGKTFVATNLFYTLLKNNYRAMLVDCDAEAPNSIAFFETNLIKESEVTQLVPVINTDTCTFCGKCHEYCNYNAIFILPPMKIIQVIEDLCHGCGACSVACKIGAISEKPVSLGQVALYSTNGLPVIIEARMNIGVMSPVPVIKEAIKQIDNKTDIVIIGCSSRDILSFYTNSRISRLCNTCNRAYTFWTQRSETKCGDSEDNKQTLWCNY